METKKYWQSVDIDGTVKTWLEASPTLHNEELYDSCGDFIEEGLFPIPLKPLQIAEIKVCENGTWSYEIEREEGWYWAKWKNETPNRANTVICWDAGAWRWLNWCSIIPSDLEKLIFSSTRIPDECII